MSVIISCDKCYTSYTVGDNAVPPTGRMVKCASCGNKWIAYPPTPKEETSPIGNDPEKVDQEIKQAPPPAPVIQYTPTPGWIKASPWVAGLIAACVALFTFHGPIREAMPGFNGFYDAVGLYQVEGIQIRNVRLEKEVEGERTSLRITGKLVNVTTAPIRLPSLRIAVLNKDYKEVGAHILPSSGRPLGGRKSYPLVNKITRLPKDGVYVKLDIGNKYELMSR